MLTVSIVWLVLAVTVTLIAAIRRSSGAGQNGGGLVPAQESGKALAALAALYGLALLAGFLCVGKFLVSSL
jgi:hypothetical protein